MSALVKLVCALALGFVFVGGLRDGLRLPDGGYNPIYLRIAPNPGPAVHYMIQRSDGGQVSMTTDEIYDLVTWAREARARERANGVCVPDWKEWPYYAPSCGFTRPADPK